MANETAAAQPDPPADTGGSDDAVAEPPASSLDALAERAAADLASLDRELAEIDLLVAQAGNESARHESRRAQLAEKLTAAAEGAAADTGELVGQLATASRRAALMEAQVDVLQGKKRAQARFREQLAGYVADLEALRAGGGVPSGGGETDLGAGALPVGVSRMVLGAQEDLRREIARAIHDGPAQSLTNIVLQAQIVERLLGRDPTAAGAEVRQLVGMVEQTLEATKSFIFDVRPMVLDDLGLVPTLRRTARERGLRVQHPVEFESNGADRRLGVDLESALFRVVDQALVAYLAAGPDRVAIRLEWGPGLEVTVAAHRDLPEPTPEDETPPAAKDLPPALAEMIEDRRASARAARPGPIALPTAIWQEIRERAVAVGATAELTDDGSRLLLRVPLPEEA